MEYFILSIFFWIDVSILENSIVISNFFLTALFRKDSSKVVVDNVTMMLAA